MTATFFKMKIKIFLTLFLLNLPVQSAINGSGDKIFNDVQILEFRFTFPDSNYLEQLYESHSLHEYIRADVSIDNQVYLDIGVRFKGNSSFYGYPGDKKSFKIKFNKFKSQTFDGLKKINLNNGWSNPTMLREKLYLDFLKEQDIPAPRANFAKVYLNDRYWGFYSLVEQVDKTFLEHRFGENEGNLFKAEQLADLTWHGNEENNYYDFYELKTNEEENDWSGLVRLINIINNTQDDALKDQLNNVLDTRGFTRVWAVNNLFMNLDSYLGSANNFYLYESESQMGFTWIIWDVNLAFGARSGKDTLDIFYLPQNRPLVKNMLANTSYKEAYMDTMQSLMDRYDALRLVQKTDSLFSLIQHDYFADSLKMYTNEEALWNLDHDLGQIPGLKTFIVNREADVQKQFEDLVIGIKEPQQRTESLLFELHPNYPNPANPTTHISFNLFQSGWVNLEIFSMTGERIQILVDKYLSAGIHRQFWQGTDSWGSPLPSGVYVLKLSFNGENQTHKIILLK